MGKQSLADFVDGWQVRARYTFTTSEAQRTTELSRDALKKSLSRLEQRRRIVVVRRGTRRKLTLFNSGRDRTSRSWTPCGRRWTAGLVCRSGM